MLNSQGLLPTVRPDQTTSLPDLPVFGYALIQQAPTIEEKLAELPDRLLLELRCSFVSVPPEAQRRQLIHLFTTPALLENYQLAAELEQDRLAAYDQAVERLLGLPEPGAPASGPGPEHTTGQNLAGAASGDRAQAVQELQTAYAALQGARGYLEILPALYAKDGLKAQLLQPLEEIVKLLPDNFLVQSEAGRLYLWLELNGKAALALDKAIDLNPAFAQPYAHRGALWMSRQRPALALVDLNRAIALDAQNPEYYYGRAVIQKVNGDMAAMCADLQYCCLLGDCEFYEWALANAECR